MIVTSSLHSKEKVAESFLGNEMSKIFLTIFEATYCNFFKLLAGFIDSDIVIICREVSILFKADDNYCSNCFEKAY